MGGIFVKVSVYGHHIFKRELFSNDNGNINENGTKAIGLDWQNNNFARASCFFVHFFAITA